MPELSPEAAAVFAEWGGQFNLSGLESLSPEVARALARLPGGRGYVGVINLSKIKTPDRDSLAELAKARRPFSFAGISELTPDVAAALVACPTWNGGLPSITGLEAPDSLAVAAALARKQGPLALLNLKRISPKTLATLIEKADVEIPRIATLTLIAEPDGSPTEDFVIPAEFQKRQQQRQR